MTIMHVAQVTLASLLPPGWTLSEPRRRGEATVELQLHPPDRESPGVGLDWTEDEGPAFARGPRYGASYRRGPGLVDLGEEDAPESLRALAHAACHALADLDEGPTLRLETARVAPIAGDPIDALLQQLPAAVEEVLGTEVLPNPEGWRLVGVKEMTRWTRVAEVALATEARSLTMILTPSDPERPAFQRGTHYDLVYYSDDLPVSDHDALYERDRVMIEAFAAWFLAWDRT
jgi:hypothetical protein